ncbi:MAG: hypothetical protein ACYSR0_12315 [Planctomycetota bacterium]|jgi:hypothetical protein
MNELIAALLGAIFAFFFLRLADFLNKVFEREERNFKALIRYQHLLNEYGIINDKNIKMVGNYGVSKDPSKLNVNFDILHEYPIEKETLQNLTNVDLVNDIFVFNAVLRSLNHNLETLSRVNRIMAQGILDGNIENDLYERTIGGIKENLESRRNDFINLFREMRSLLFTINYLIKKKPIFHKIVGKLSNRRLSKIFLEYRHSQMEKPYKLLDRYKRNEE